MKQKRSNNKNKGYCMVISVIHDLYVMIYEIGFTLGIALLHLTSLIIVFEMMRQLIRV